MCLRLPPMEQETGYTGSEVAHMAFWKSGRSENASTDGALLAEARENASALGAVVRALSGVSTAEEAAKAALDSIRQCFGWAYGSHWKVDPADNVLRFATESG